MTLQGQQLGQSHQEPGPFPLASAFSGVNVGLLGNESIQTPAKALDPFAVMKAYATVLATAQPSFKLALLKKQKFTLEARQQRIALSLEALNAAQLTNLSLAQWKEIVEEVEDED